MATVSAGLPRVACLLAATSCGLVFEATDRPGAPPGAALEAFKRDLGLAATPAEGPTQAAPGRASSAIATLSPEARAALVAERERARAILAEAMRGGRDLDGLPSGSDRVDRLARAIGLLDLQRPEEAERLLRRILAEEPRHFPALEFLGEALDRRGRHGEAERIWRDLAVAFPAEPTFPLRRAESLFAQQDESKAQAALALLESMVPGPHALLAVRLLFERYRRQYRAAAAATVVRRALAAQPEEPELRLLLGQTLRFQGKHDEAIRTLQPVADRPGGAIQARAIYEMVWSYRGLERFDDALSRLEDLEKGDFEDFRRANMPLLRTLRGSLERERELGRRVSFSGEELRYLVRECRDEARREEALDSLVTYARQNPKLAPIVTEDCWHVLREDESAGLRRGAMMALLELGDQRVEPILELARDKEPRNRMVAATQLVRFPPDRAKAWLFELLLEEEHAKAFRHLHGLLERLTGAHLFLAAGAVDTAESRQRIRADWAKRLGVSKAAGK